MTKGVIDLFCGAGGFSWGWHRAGLKPLAAVDNDPSASRTYELNFGHAHTLVLNRDLGEFDPAGLSALLGKGRAVYAISGGPPCQGWSKAGRAKLRSLSPEGLGPLQDPRNKLFRQFVEFVRAFKPPVVVMENVPGMLNIEGKNFAELVNTALRESGYHSDYSVVNARWFGVPQDRRRIIFIGVRRDLGVGIPVRELEDFGPRFRSETVGLQGETNLKQAIGDLPAVPHGIREDPQPYRRRPGRRSRFAELMRERSDGLVTDHVCKEHNAQDLEAFALMEQGGQYHELPSRLKRYRDDIFRDKYKKLAWDRPTGTVTAHFEKDAYTHIHPGQPRTISIREAARLQSFPDDFRFAGNMGDRFRQIGNAVPPLMAWGIAEFLLRHLPPEST